MADFNFFAPRTKQEPEKKKKKREPLDHSWATRPHGNCCEGDSELCPRWTARIDEGACETWTYPNNYPVRQYQEQIVKQALLKNTLVCLPTGLGKTLIAAVLMYNYHRWFPDGQIIFMAPTKPLVAQQVEACHDVVGLPEEDTAQLDGNVPVERRRELWRKRRVFYCTPQTVANDLAKGVFDASRVVLLVVDEAHRALKKYAYCSVVKHVGFRHAHFRVLALSATPGSDVAGVQDVVDNLRIAHVEVRTEDDPDVAKYTHHRLIEKIICEEGPVVKKGLEALQKVAEPFLKRLQNAGALHSTDLSTLRAYTVLQAGRDSNRVAYSDRHVAHKLASAADALRHYGTTGALEKLESVRSVARDVAAKLSRSESVPPGDRALQRLAGSPQFLEALKALRSSGEHPKTTKLRELLVDHFQRAREAHKSSRAMVFTGTRQSVDEIGDALSRASGDLLRVQRFVGQGGGDGMKQSSQKNAVEAFLRNDSNVLVATCIAEEGLDIGAVDVCVFYDQVGSPIRMVQRMGRTARKRTGRVVLLMVPGEEKKFESSGKRSAAVVTALRDRRGLRLRTDLSKRLVPRRVQPSWPRRVDKRLSIDAWRSSQVGGQVKRKLVDPARAAARQDRSWRLNEKQLQVVKQRNWTGPVQYKARLADGWRRALRSGHAGRPPPRTGQIVAPPASSSRSALLRAAADFVALRGFDDLYDLEKLSAQNGAMASVAFQKKMPRHAAFAGNDVSACVEILRGPS
jgi:ERCC4-related helicase